MGLPEFSRRWEVGQQLIQANGVTYNVYGDPRGSGAPVADGPGAAGHRRRRSGRTIERAVIQRATLLNAILADLYGTQRLVRDGHIPPELVFDNPGFLRPCHGIVPHERRLPAQLRGGHRARAERRTGG